jgi:hypothetical protein
MLSAPPPATAGTASARPLAVWNRSLQCAWAVQRAAADADTSWPQTPAGLRDDRLRARHLLGCAPAASGCSKPSAALCCMLGAKISDGIEKAELMHTHDARAMRRSLLAVRRLLRSARARASADAVAAQRTRRSAAQAGCAPSSATQLLSASRRRTHDARWAAPASPRLPCSMPPSAGMTSGTCSWRRDALNPATWRRLQRAHTPRSARWRRTAAPQAAGGRRLQRSVEGTMGGLEGWALGEHRRAAQRFVAGSFTRTGVQAMRALQALMTLRLHPCPCFHRLRGPARRAARHFIPLRSASLHHRRWLHCQL